MVLEHRFICPLPHGLHARPASHLEAEASRFAAEISLINTRSGVKADAKSVLSLISSDVRQGDSCLLQISGPDETKALSALTVFLRDKFPHCDEALPEIRPTTAAAPLPLALKAAGVTRVLIGTPVSRGLGQGQVVSGGGFSLRPDFTEPPAGSPSEEIQRFHQAVASVRDKLEQEIARVRGPQAEMLKAHAALLRDPALSARVEFWCQTAGQTAGQAVLRAVEEFAATLRQTGRAYLQERVLDLQDIAARLFSGLYGEKALIQTPTLTGPSIVVAENLTPSQFLALDRRQLRGLLLAHAGTTSHTVILARSFGVPTLIGVNDLTTLPEGQAIILDADRGFVLPEATESVRRYYALETRRILRQQEIHAAFRHRAALSADGQPLPVLANVASATEVAPAIAHGAEGIGLFRTEMLFMDRSEAPTEDEQYAIYVVALEGAQGYPVIFRTVDIGGDKPVSYLPWPTETNPFLGVRGARLYAEFGPLIHTQLRALLRAAAHGPLKIMVPMIACAEEMRAFRALVQAAQTSLGQTTPLPPVGAMLEIPSAIFALDELSREADFFSLGTNDLQQYFLAADRDNARVADLYTWTHPSFLRFLRQAVHDAHAHGRPIGLCGEMGEQAQALPLLLGLGLDSISLSAPRITATKASLSRYHSARCRHVAEEMTRQADRQGVIHQLDHFQAENQARPLFEEATIALEIDASTKGEVIKQLVDLLALSGRTENGEALEEAIWQREATYSTGFGHGFAMPHCQSEHLQANTIALARLRAPVEWGSLDGNPVRVVLLLAIRASDHDREHMRIFSRLSRLVMREEFRSALEKAEQPGAILQALATHLDLSPPPSTAS